jgi:hypothetical protein
VIESLDYFVQKAGHNETLGYWDGNTARAQIKEFVLVDQPGRGAVGAMLSARISNPGIELASASSLNRRLRTF